MHVYSSHGFLHWFLFSGSSQIQSSVAAMDYSKWVRDQVIQEATLKALTCPYIRDAKIWRNFLFNRLDIKFTSIFSQQVEV
jgi:hypothetical protein